MAFAPPQKVSIFYKAMADDLLADPSMSHRDLGAKYGRTPAWIAAIIHSDIFQAYYEERRAELIDPELAMSLDDRLKGLAMRSVEKVMELVETAPPSFALKAAQFSTEALGYGSKAQAAPVSNVQFVVNLPPRAADADSWAASHRPKGDVIDVPSRAPAVLDAP